MYDIWLNQKTNIKTQNVSSKIIFIEWLWKMFKNLLDVNSKNIWLGKNIITDPFLSTKDNELRLKWAK